MTNYHCLKVGRHNRQVQELKKRIIPLTMDNLLIALNYLKSLIHHIQSLIRAMTHGKGTT
jgi:hypothetical protein